MSYEVGSTVGGDMGRMDLRTHHRSDGEHSRIVSIPAVPLLVTVLIGDLANVWMYQMPKTLQMLPWDAIRVSI